MRFIAISCERAFSSSKSSISSHSIPFDYPRRSLSSKWKSALFKRANHFQHVLSCSQSVFLTFGLKMQPLIVSDIFKKRSILFKLCINIQLQLFSRDLWKSNNSETMLSISQFPFRDRLVSSDKTKVRVLWKNTI